MRILGNNVTIESRCVDNVNTMLIGAPGTGKTRTYVLPNMMSAEEESLVILDPKGEIHDISANLMKKKGYKPEKIDFESAKFYIAEERVDDAKKIVYAANHPWWKPAMISVGLVAVLILLALFLPDILAKIN